MFEPLAKIVKLLSQGFTAFSKYKNNQEREEAVTQILEVYFLIKDCVDDGEQLLNDCDWNPIGKIKSLSTEQAEVTAKKWDMIISRQGIRLYDLQGHIFADHHLSILNPELQDKLSDVIGSKMDRAVTLHGIGAALFFNAALKTAETPVEKAGLIEYMAGAEEKGPLNMEQIISEILNLRAALDEYRAVVERLVTNEELVSLSNKARERATAAGGREGDR